MTDRFRSPVEASAGGSSPPRARVQLSRDRASEGLYYQGKGWFPDVWSAIRSQDRYGDDWFRGCYHFLKFDQDGEQQANYYLQTVEDAGGWDKADFWPIVDVELGSDSNSNHKATTSQVIECTTAFATPY